MEIDYGCPENIAEQLRLHEVDTVVSALGLNFDSVSESQLNLIRGAAQATVVKRFIPSDFNVDYSVSDMYVWSFIQLFFDGIRAVLLCRSCLN